MVARETLRFMPFVPRSARRARFKSPYPTCDKAIGDSHMRWPELGATPQTSRQRLKRTGESRC